MTLEKKQKMKKDTNEETHKSQVSNDFHQKKTRVKPRYNDKNLRSQISISKFNMNYWWYTMKYKPFIY